MIDIYSEIQNAKNPSEWINKDFRIKKRLDRKIYLVAKNMAELNRLKDNYRGHNLITASYCEQDKQTGKPFKCSEINGIWFPNIYCRKGSSQSTDLCFNPAYKVYGNLNEVIALDVTEDFIKKYNKIGKCLLHDESHLFVESRDHKKKTCKVCKKSYKLFVKIVKKTEWKEVK